MINWVGEEVQEPRRSECASHVPAIKAFFKEAHVFVSAQKPDDVTEESIGSVVSKIAPPSERARRMSCPVDTKEAVGTNYRKTNAAMEMRRINRDSFWARAEREEELRKEEERRRVLEERRRWEKERVMQERREAEERERRLSEKEQLLQEQRMMQAKMEAEARKQEKAKWEVQQQQHEEEMRARFRRSESIEKAAEAAVLVSQRSMNPREFFRQLSSSSSRTPPSPGSPRTVKPPFRRYQRSLTDTAFIFGKSDSSTPTSPRSPTVVSPFSRTPTSPLPHITRVGSLSPPSPGRPDPTFRPITQDQSPTRHVVPLTSPPTSPQRPTLTRQTAASAVPQLRLPPAQPASQSLPSISPELLAQTELPQAPAHSDPDHSSVASPPAASSGLSKPLPPVLEPPSEPQSASLISCPPVDSTPPVTEPTFSPAPADRAPALPSDTPVAPLASPAAPMTPPSPAPPLGTSEAAEPHTASRTLSYLQMQSDTTAETVSREKAASNEATDSSTVAVAASHEQEVEEEEEELKEEEEEEEEKRACVPVHIEAPAESVCLQAMETDSVVQAACVDEVPHSEPAELHPEAEAGPTSEESLKAESVIWREVMVGDGDLQEVGEQRVESVSTYIQETQPSAPPLDIYLIREKDEAEEDRETNCQPDQEPIRADPEETHQSLAEREEPAGQPANEMDHGDEDEEEGCEERGEQTIKQNGTAEPQHSPPPRCGVRHEVSEKVYTMPEVAELKEVENGETESTEPRTLCEYQAEPQHSPPPRCGVRHEVSEKVYTMPEVVELKEEENGETESTESQQESTEPHTLYEYQAEPQHSPPPRCGVRHEVSEKVYTMPEVVELKEEENGETESTESQQESTEPGRKLCVRALYEYQAEDESELSLEPGDIISAVETVNQAWLSGCSKDGRQGMFPANYVEAL
ncbi:drebrin isoform X2 [Amia ocellicauda]